MKKIISAVLLTMICFNTISTVGLAENNGAMYLYVDTKAGVSGDGSFEMPFKTIDEAKLRIREIKKESGYPKDGIVVSIREGDYTVLDGIKFGEEDGGTEENPIVYRAYGNERVRLLGGNEVSFNKFTPVTDERILAKLSSGMNGKIYQLDLDENNITPFGEFGIFGHAASGMNSAGQNPTSGSALPMIFWNGENTKIAQYPNDGHMVIDKVLSSGSTTDYSQEMSFTVADSRVSAWADVKDAWLWGMLRYDWSDIHLPIAAFDGDTSTITTKYSCDYGVLSGQKLYVYNLIEELDSPGEWYLDKDTNILYMYPLTNDMNATLLMAFSTKAILGFNKASHITFRDVAILGSAGGVSINACRNIDIKYCEIAYMSGNGVMANGDPGGRTFGDSTYDCDLIGCHIYNVGGNGAYFHYVGNRGDLTQGNCKIHNNWIHDFGTITQTYCGGVSTRGVGVDIAFNLIHDGPHLALNPGGNDITIRYNDIHSVLKKTSDSGIIYFGGDTTARGTVIENNIIHDCTTSSTQHAIHAVYIDDAGAGATVRKNIVYNVGGNGVFINGGRNNTVENNIFANLSGVGAVMKAAFISGDWYTGWETGKLGNSLFKNPVDYTSEPYSKYPNMTDMADDDPPFPKYNVMKNNVSYNSAGGHTIDPLSSGYSVKEIASWGEYGEEMIAKRDVGFKDAKNNDFSLNEDSEVFEKLPEFENIESERVGLVTSRLRKALSKNAVAMVVNEPRTYVNWKRTMIDEDNLDVVPFIKDNITYVPLRYLFESFNAAVEWNDGVVNISYNGKNITLTQGSDIATIDGVEAKLAGKVATVNDRTFVPLRSCSELVGKKVFWDENNSGLIIISDKDMENTFSYEEMVSDLVSRLSEI